MHLSSLVRYPLKSCRAEPLMRVELESRGLVHDRRWMVVDDADRFITARKNPELLLVTVDPRPEGAIALSAPGRGACEAIRHAKPTIIQSSVWSDDCAAIHLQGADEWLSDLLQQAARLVYMPDGLERPVNSDYGHPGDLVSFADGFPILVANQSSLDDLNTRLDSPITMARFRPNLVVEGAEPYEEFSWRRIRVGDLEFVSGGPCVRCVMTTKDPDTAAADGTGEPLKTLSTYQRNDSGAIFGLNLIPRGVGVLEVGQRVEVLERD
jgi:uncharacterized protein